MVEYSIELDKKEMYRKLKRMGSNMGEISEKILGLIGMEVVTVSNRDYLSGPRPHRLDRVSGDLAQSLYSDNKGSLWNLKAWELTIGTNLPYAARWEFGGQSKKGTKLNARPFLKPALDDTFNSGRAERIADQELQRQLDKVK